MDQEIRNKLRNVVTQCRRLLEDDTRDALEGKFGIFARKDQVTADPNAQMTHLTEEEQAARKDILAHYAHIKARGFKPKDALDQLIREIAFTHLNRLCAYKMMEAREVYVGGQKFREAVSRGVNSNGVKFYLAEHEEDERLFNTGHQDVAYRHFLDWLGGLLSDEIGVLFNPNDPANRLYPRQKTLDDVLDLLNGGGIKAEETELREAWPQIWSQDETIGWVYQYFTPKELRDKARKESQAPRNSYELAFRNQFFTPRYVVEFLTDNTLGRIWYEMRKGDTKLKDQCRYMVRRPTEIFLKDGEHPPKDAAEGKDDLSQEELLKLPVHIPHRPKKDPRELKILDPACGSGHFLLYCFDLLLTMYEEAYEEQCSVFGVQCSDKDAQSASLKTESLKTEHSPFPPLPSIYPSLEALRRDVPRLILAHNLHGIDIDLRASQIAALALWLRCQRAYQDMGLKKDRPQITRSNFVCAEPMPGEEQMLKEFVGQLEPKVLGQVVEVVFDKMKLAGEAGSLLKIEEEIRDAVAAAKKQYVRETTHATDKKGRTLLFTEAQMARLSDKPQQASLFDVSDITDNQFFEQAEARVIDALREYAEKAQNGERLQRRLFTEDAVRGFAFVDLCQKRYDVVLMNPPFGDPSLPIKEWLKGQYGSCRNDLYGAFVWRGGQILTSAGILGAITNRTGFFLGGYSLWRQHCIYGLGTHLALLCDLGSGVLDTALVETAMYVVSQTIERNCGVIRLVGIDDKPLKLRQTIDDAVNCVSNKEDPTWVTASTFSAIPNAPFSYWLPHSLLRLFASDSRMEPTELQVRAGLRTLDDFRFLRLIPEIPTNRTSNANYKPCLKGGPYRRYLAHPHLMCWWADDGCEIKKLAADRYGSVSRIIQAQGYYLRRELTYSRRTSSRLGVRIAPSGCLFTDKGPLIVGIPDDTDHLFFLLGLLNSDIVEYLMAASLGAGEGAARSYEVGLIQRLPCFPLQPEVKNQIASRTQEITALLQRLVSFDVLSPLCDLHFPLCGSIADISNAVTKLFEDARNQIAHLRDANEDALVRGFNIESNRAVISEFFAGPRPDEKPTSDEDEIEDDDEAVNNFGLPQPPSLSHVGKLILEVCIGTIFGRFSSKAVFSEPPIIDPSLLFEDAIDSQGVFSNTENGRFVVDDPDHTADIVRRVREVLELVWKNRAEAIEKEACEILGVKELRDYFRKPGKGGFWDDHISRYSKSRRKAPIYWLLQSSKKNYAIWLYYHRLDKDLLFKALVNYVEPKSRLETNRFESLRSQKAAAGESGKVAKRLAKDVERQEDFLSELRDFEDKLRRAANLHLEPDLNDGVVLNIAPLHELVPWKEAKKYWNELLAGKYEWSSIGKQLRERGIVK